jgi:hypothetical protein
VATSCKVSDSRAVKEFAEIMNCEDKGNKLLLHQSVRRDIPGDWNLNIYLDIRVRNSGIFIIFHFILS